MFPSGPPSAKEIEKIARRTTNIIKVHITENVCVFGSTAAHLWADIGRVPGVRTRLLNPYLMPLTSHAGHRHPSPPPVFRRRAY
jgi:hypothetical protein